jgi:ParB family chromosome partitioning protein
MTPEKRPALGRGLSALIPDVPAQQPAAEIAHATRGAPIELDLDLLEPNRFQPRAQFDEGRLDELAQSLRTSGLIQPLVVRRHGERFEIIAGERRWRAAQRAGLLKVPVVVRDVPDERLLEVALIENIQREDLNPIDEALAYKRLLDEFQFTQERIADATGRDRTSVANYLRLLKLPDDVRKLVAAGELSMGHARAIVSLDAALARQAATRVVKRQLSVRQTEALVKQLSTPSEREPEAPKDMHTRHAEETMRLALGTRVRIVRRGKGGHLEIDFVSEEELHRLYERLTERR